MIEINALSPRQTVIAQLLWTADTWKQTETIVEIYGREAHTIRLLIAFACIDDDVVEAKHCTAACELLDYIWRHQ